MALSLLRRSLFLYLMGIMKVSTDTVQLSLILIVSHNAARPAASAKQRSWFKPLLWTWRVPYPRHSGLWLQFGRLICSTTTSMPEPRVASCKAHSNDFATHDCSSLRSAAMVYIARLQATFVVQEDNSPIQMALIAVRTRCG